MRFLARILLVLPALYIAIKSLDGSLGAWEYADLQDYFGDTAITLLILVLCLTPLKLFFPRWSLVSALNAHRRAIGISCFLYATFHGFLYFYQAEDAAEVVRDLQQFVYLQLGITGIVLLSPLFLTSNDLSVRFLTYKWWKRLHRLAYVAAFILFFHRSFSERADMFATLLMFSPLILLESLRIVRNLVAGVVRKPTEKKPLPPKPAWSGSRPFKIDRIVPEAAAVRSFYLKPVDAKNLSVYKAGQYLTFRFDIPGQEKPVVRCYSLSDAPGHDYYRISVKRLPPPRDKPDVPPGLSSSYLHDQVKEGDIVNVLAPNGDFCLSNGKPRNVVLLGAGIGVTPVLSMLNHLDRTGIEDDSNIWFFYGVRDGSEQIMKEHLRSLADKSKGLKLTLCYSDPRPEDVEGRDFQRHGRISMDLLKEMLPHNGFDFYFCGPGSMMADLAEGLEEWGVDEGRIHYEAFGPSTVRRKKAATHTGESFHVDFDQTGKTLTWTGEAESILEFAEANGLELPYGCRMGNCGTCAQQLVKGEVRYPVAPSYTPKKGYCLTCTSVPVSDIELKA